MKLNLPPLPITQKSSEILNLVSSEGISMVQAPPGTGKSTILPLILLNLPDLQGRQILLLQPRRAAARAITDRLRQLAPDHSIGLLTRKKRDLPEKPEILVMTEGVYLRRLLNDPEQSDTAVVLFDEFHERSLQADLSLTLSLQCREIYNDRLTIQLLSATLNQREIRRALGREIPSLTLEDNLFPVDLTYKPQPPQMYDRDFWVERALDEMNSCPGDILFFLPGQGEIEQVAQRLREHGPSHWDICRLYGKLSVQEQRKALQPAPKNTRKIILSTNIAETSLTLPGIRSVIDSGLRRVRRFLGDGGLSRLETLEISRASAIQRMGRAGRVGPGRCIRLWSEKLDMAEQDDPAILREDLTGLLLNLALWGDSRVDSYTWITPPNSLSLKHGYEQLKRWKLLDGQGMITPLGERIAALPLSPGLALLIHDRSTARIAAMAELGDPMRKEQAERWGSSLECRLDLLEEFRITGQHPGLNSSLARDIIHEEQRLLKRRGSLDGSASALHPAEVFPLRVAKYMGEHSYQIASGRQLLNHPGTGKEDPPWLLVLQGDSGRQSQGRIYLSLTLDDDFMEDYLKRYAPSEVTLLLTRDGLLKARKLRRLGAIPLGEQPVALKDCTNWKSALVELLSPMDQDPFPNTELRTRLAYLHRNLGAPWPAVDRQALMKELPQWLDIHINLPLKENSWKIFNLDAALKGSIPWELQGRLDELAPQMVDIPQGRPVKLEYREDRVIMKVQIQRVFGMKDTPKVGGKPVEMHLLSPAQRPIQITSDLRGFWQGSYREVRKEMAGRYVKHAWPEDPTKSAG